ncbi:hypothetical protein [Modestobacter sp. SYSU DS0657]
MAASPGKAVLVGCAAGPGKARWLEQLHTSPDYPRLTQVALFHEDKEEDWRLDSDPASLRVSRRYLSRAPQERQSLDDR